MIIQNSYLYVQIGLCLRLLHNISSSTKAKIVLDTIDQLTYNLLKGNFEVSVASMRSDTHRAMLEAIGSLDKMAPIEQLSVTIRKEFYTLEQVVFAEAVTKKIYLLPPRRFNSDYLLGDPGKLLKDGAFEKLEEIARTDITSSCRCILFGEATAASFHILRATESVLKSYYFHHRRQNRLSTPMWGPMVDQLRAKKRNRPSDSLLTSLDLIRAAYRNPTQHPEAIYEIDSAQDLFGVCLDVIGKMCSELE